MIEDLHPDVSKVVWKFNRWHHHVNYNVYSENKPIIKFEAKEIDYGLILTEK